MLSDILKPRITELGSIRIGKKGEARQGQNGTYRLPQKLDHFILTKLTRNAQEDLEQDQELMSDLAAQGYADADGHLRRLPIRVLSNDPEDIMQASYCWYHGKKLGGRSDGKTVTFFLDTFPSKERWGQPLSEPIEKKWTEEIAAMVDGRNNRLFKVHATFNCMIASKSARFGGVYKFRTTSKITADQLYGGLGQILQLSNGMLMGMPLQLCIRPLQVSPEAMQGKTTKVYVVHVELVGDDLRAIQQQANEQARFMLETTDSTKRTLAAYRKVLRTPGDEIDPIEIADIQQEFHPEESTDETEAFPMPQSTDAPPPSEIDDPTVTVPPVAEEKPKEEPKKRGRKKKEPEQTVEPPAEEVKHEEPKPVEEPKTEPAETKEEEKPKPEMTIQEEFDHWIAAIDATKTLEELAEMKAVGSDMVDFYNRTKDGYPKLAQALVERGRNQKLGILRRQIEDIYEADDWTDKGVKELARSIGIANIDTMDADQAGKLLNEMKKNKKSG